jgi:predicted AlkP superfamily pyrophosphatase or phosphodiesterase
MRVVAITPLLCLALACLALAACGRPDPRTEPGVVQQGAIRPLRGRVTDHVVVISIDGLRPDAIAKYDARSLQRLMDEGRYSLTAQTIALSKTLPSHMSMVTGVDADRHGITWNSDRVAEHGHVTVPTMFGLARNAGLTTAAFFSKTKFHHLEVPNTLDFSRSPKRAIAGPWPSSRTVEYVGTYLESNSPNLLFVHLAEPDFAGHTFGWMGWMYGMAVREADMAVGRVLEQADRAFGRGMYTVIVTADHGGHKKTHGTADPEDRTIPWIVWGAGVQRGDTLSGVRTMDTAATVLWMLRLEVPDDWAGRPLTAAFQPTLATKVDQ